jgi:hypothetical protein
VKLATHFQVVPRSRKRGSLQPLPHTPSRNSAYLVKHRDLLPFIYYYQHYLILRNLPSYRVNNECCIIFRCVQGNEIYVRLPKDLAPVLQKEGKSVKRGMPMYRNLLLSYRHSSGINAPSVCMYCMFRPTATSAAAIAFHSICRTSLYWAVFTH